MAKKKEPERISYFEFLAEIGATKHIGGIRVTEELAGLCHIKEGGKYVLEVGCGIGLTSAFLAKKYGCRIVGIDLSRKMIERARENAKREGVADKTEFVVGDAQKLPFKKNTFDAVICESVMIFIPDKKKAVKEFIRVTKPGGYVGLEEVAWINKPSKKIKERLDGFFGSEIMTPGGWKKLLADSGLENIVARTRKQNMLNEVFDQMGRWNIIEYFKVHYRFWAGFITKPSYRRFIWDALKLPWNLMDYWGYGIYAGRKRK